MPAARPAGTCELVTAHGALRLQAETLARDAVPVETDRGRGSFGLLDLHLVEPRRGAWTGYLLVNERVAPVAAVARLAAGFGAALRWCALHPDAPLARAPALPLV